MTLIDKMQGLVKNFDLKDLKEENIECVENTKEKEEFRKYLEQTIYEKCLEVGSKMENAKTDEEINAADDEYINLENNCCVFMTREEFGVIRDKAYDKLYENEINKLMSINKEDITVDTVKDFININTNLYWKIINENDLGIFGLCEKGLKYNNAYYMKARGLKHRLEKQPIEETKQMYFDLKKDYEALVEIEKKYAAPPVIDISTLYKCKFRLGGADEDTSHWDESDAEYHEMDLRYFSSFIDELDAKYDDRLDSIDDYRYTVSNLTQDELGELESLFDKIEGDLDYCWISYDVFEVEAA